MENHRLISALVIGGLLGISGCSDTCSSWWSCPNAGTVDTDMGVPPGSAPYVKWSPARVPIGAPTIEVLAGRASDATVTLEQINKSSISVNVTQRTNNNDGTWWLTLETPSSSWTTLSAGTANLVLSNKDGSASKELILVKPAFSVPLSYTTLAASQLLSMGLIDNKVNVFGIDSAKQIWAWEYQNGTLINQISSLMTGQSYFALTNFLQNGCTSFVSVSKPPGQQVFHSYSAIAGNGYNSYACFTSPWKTVNIASIAVGDLDKGRALLVLEDIQSNLYSCIFAADTNMSGSCVGQSVKPTAVPMTMWIRSLDTTTGIGQIVALGAGGLSIWASDSNGNLTDRTTAAGLVKRTDLNLLAVEDMDGDKSPDLVGVSPSAVVVFLNNGRGVFREVKTSLPSLSVKTVTLGDIDKDGRPDVILTAVSTGKVWVLLNAADDGIGNGRLVGPTDTGIAVGDGGVLTLDGQDVQGTGRRIIWHNPGNLTLNVANNLTLP